MRPSPPDSTAELLHRAHALAGLTLTELADELRQSLPVDLRRDKGTVGQLIELALGASAGSRAEPDFPHLAVELKTLPVDRNGKPLESTYVCVAPMAQPYNDGRIPGYAGNCNMYSGSRCWPRGIFHWVTG